MARAVFPYELDDPDFSWLLSKFREENPGYLIVDSPALPLILIDPGTQGIVAERSILPLLPPPMDDGDLMPLDDDADEPKLP